MCRSVKFVLAVATALGLGVPDPVSAQDSTSGAAVATLADLMKMTVTTATRTAEDAIDAPARVQIVTAAEIQGRGYRSLSDVLKDLADFKVDIAGDQDLPYQLTVQGTRGGNRIVFMLDGVRIASPTGEPLPVLANYPVHNARQIEILYGPASALYGADAFSAVINIISKDAVESAGLQVGTTTGQFGLYNQTLAYGRSLGSKLRLVVSGQYQYDAQPDLTKYYPDDFQGLQGQKSGTFNTIFGPMSPMPAVSGQYESPISAHSFHASLKRGGLQLSFFESRARVSTSVGYRPDNAVYSSAVYNQNDLAVGSGTYSRAFRDMTSTSTVTISRHELDPQSGYWNVYSNMTRSYKFAYGSSVRAEEQVSWSPGARMAFVGGGSFERFYAIPQGADVNAPISSRTSPGTVLGTTIVDDFNVVRYSNTAAYGQLKYAPTPKLALTLGGRIDHNTEYGTTTNPRIGLVARPVSGTTLKVLYGTAFLAPSPYQKYAHWGSFYSLDGGATYISDFWHIPNPNLKPQHKRTFEVNVIQEMGLNFSLSAAAFRSHLDDLVQESDPEQSGPGTFKGWPVSLIHFSVNEGHATSFGGSLGIDYLRSFDAERRVAARAAVAIADGRVSQDHAGEGLPTASIAPLQLRFTADIDWAGWGLAPRLAMVGRQRVNAVADGQAARETIPGYVTLDVHVRRQHVIKGLNAFLTIENAFDRRYRHINARAYANAEEFIGAPQNPRRVIAGIDIRLWK